MPTPPLECLAVVLIGHGAPATDCPPQLIGELMGLEWRQDHHGGGAVEPPPQVRERIERLDAQIRDWPRHAGNDPYKHGLERLAEALRPLVPAERVAVGYNEFCRPGIAEAVAQVIQAGATRVLIIPSMLTPGGVHAEKDIPRALEGVRRQHPGIRIEYVWPFRLRQVAELLAAHVAETLGRSA